MSKLIKLTKNKNQDELQEFSKLLSDDQLAQLNNELAIKGFKLSKKGNKLQLAILKCNKQTKKNKLTMTIIRKRNEVKPAF